MREKKSYIGYLEALLAAEIEERERNTIDRRIKETHLPQVKTLEEFEYMQSPMVSAARPLCEIVDKIIGRAAEFGRVTDDRTMLLLRYC